MADQISDAVVDALIAQDKYSRVACETLLKGQLVVVAGEIRSRGSLDIPSLVRKTIADIGYISSQLGFDLQHCQIVEALDPQSADIAQGVDAKSVEDQGAGDQGMMFGFACTDTSELMPAPIALAHRLMRKLDSVRRSDLNTFFGPDGKAQVTFVYDDLKPIAIDNIIVSAQHAPDISQRDVHEAIVEQVIRPALVGTPWDLPKKMYINPTGRFVMGGPVSDTGLTGRKIIVDTYGGMGRHGGGAFSGKDPSKVDRSAAYFARYMAKQVIASGVASHCEVQLGYAIGRADPVSWRVDTFGSGKVDDARIERALRDVFDARPGKMIEHLDLLRPIYQKTAVFGHFGENSCNQSWEEINCSEELASYFK